MLRVYEAWIKSLVCHDTLFDKKYTVLQFTSRYVIFARSTGNLDEREPRSPRAATHITNNLCLWCICRVPLIDFHWKFKWLPCLCLSLRVEVI